jgi:hypothetical protein
MPVERSDDCPSTGVGPLRSFQLLCSKPFQHGSLFHVIVARPSFAAWGIIVNGVNVIERAYQLATESGSIEEIKKKLAREGYVNVHAHLGGRQIRHDLLERLNPQLVPYRKSTARA